MKYECAKCIRSINPQTSNLAGARFLAEIAVSTEPAVGDEAWTGSTVGTACSVGLADSARAVARIEEIDSRPCCLIALCTAAAAAALRAPPPPAEPTDVCAVNALSFCCRSSARRISLPSFKLSSLFFFCSQPTAYAAAFRQLSPPKQRTFGGARLARRPVRCVMP